MPDTNLSNISATNWVSIRSEIEQIKQTNSTKIDTNLTNLLSESYIQGVANNNPDIILQKEKAKTDVTSAINSLSDTVNHLQSALKQLLQTQKMYAEDANRIRNEIDNEKTELEKAQQLNKVRKEQAESLHIKYDGNLHSSWMGIWIPLSDEFRVGILVLTFVLFMSIFVILGFLIYGGYIPAFWKRSIVGGSYLKKTRT